MGMEDIALSFDLIGSDDCLGFIALFGSAGDPFAIDLESCQPHFAVTLQIDVKAVLNVDFFEQFVHA